MMVSVAFYKGKKTIKRPQDLGLWVIDGMIRMITHSPYSHCEIVIDMQDGCFDCYSSSYRDGGVRKKTMALPSDQWDILPTNVPLERILSYYAQTQGLGYDLLGVLSFVFRLKHNPKKYFCSEWCFNALTNQTNGERYSPDDLYHLITGDIQ
ncbi:enoyl-CoA hydratase [Moraxella haemolytica]|uniref:enoyl-CoA hydratase n=1 Tax=Moraxella haemolytica TaxID=2904119 RepID=UPI0025426EDA|nr:enoyl-CoA hydratase [Moraxella sp. ZY171148]WII94707.1 enoyl-CoA hydratase [Moraxella sp. ZY171148]